MKVIDFFRNATEDQLVKFLDESIDDNEVFNHQLCRNCKNEHGGVCMCDRDESFQCNSSSRGDDIKKWLNIEIENFDELL